MKNKGKLVIEKTILRQTKHAVYIDIILKDKEGKLFKMYGSSFLFDLKEIKEQ